LYIEKLSLCNLDVLSFGYTFNASEREWLVCCIWWDY